MSEAEMALWAAYLAKEPAPVERLEVAVAQLTAITISMQSKRSRGKKIGDYLVFREAWKYTPKSSGNEAVDADIKHLLAAFAPRLIIKNPA